MANSILIFGDSIAWGRGEQPNIGWAGRLKQVHEQKGPWHTVYNLAIPGETTTNILKHLEIELQTRISSRKDNVVKVILAIGINDSEEQKGIQKITLEQFEKNISEVLTAIKKHVQSVYIIGLTNLGGKEVLEWEEGKNYFLERIKNYDDCLKKVSERFDCTFVDVLDVLGLNDLADGLHPNTEGYEKLAKKIIPILTK